jgi:hypothetical protein
MARIRSIKPEFWTSEQIMGLNPLTRLLFIGMWNFADDYGRMPYAPATIKAQILPGDTMEIQMIRNMLTELSSAGLILLYTAKGREYLKPHKPKHPGPVADEPESIDEQTAIVAEPSPNVPRILVAGEDRIGEEKKEDSALGAAKEKSRKKPATSLPGGWLPSDASKAKAKELGLSDAEFGRESEKFKNHARQNDRRVVLWDSAFDNWCINAAQYLGKQPKTQNLGATWRAMPGDPEFLAWKAYAKDNNRGALTRLLDQRELEGRGFDFESRWPPGHKEAA